MYGYHPLHTFLPYFKCNPNHCHVGSATKLPSRDQRSRSQRALFYLIRLLAKAQGSAQGNPLSSLLPTAPHHIHTFFLSTLFYSFAPSQLLTPIALARNTAPCCSWQNSAGSPCVPEKPAFSPSSLQPTRTFLTFLPALCEHFSPFTSSRLPSTAGQGGTDTSSHLHYIHILPLSLSMSLKSL